MWSQIQTFFINDMKTATIPGFIFTILIYSGISFFLGSQGFWLISNSFSTLRIGLQSSAWVPTQGQICGFRVRGGTDAMSGVASYYCQFSYTYTVEGVQYRIQTVGQGHFIRSEDAEAEAQEKYATDQRIRIFYNPKKPSEATLSFGVNENTLATVLIMFLTGFLFFIGSIFALRWVVAWFIIGEPPLSGCYDPDIFFQRKWVQVSCDYF